jgi:ankyrin repeat protein
MLCTQGCAVNATDSKGATVAHAAAARNQAGVLRVLEQFGANLTLRNRSGNSPLHTAAKYGAVDAMTTLVRTHHER